MKKTKKTQNSTQNSTKDSAKNSKINSDAKTLLNFSEMQFVPLSDNILAKKRGNRLIQLHLGLDKPLMLHSDWNGLIDAFRAIRDDFNHLNPDEYNYRAAYSSLMPPFVNLMRAETWQAMVNFVVWYNQSDYLQNKINGIERVPLKVSEDVDVVYGYAPENIS